MTLMLGDGDAAAAAAEEGEHCIEFLRHRHTTDCHGGRGIVLGAILVVLVGHKSAEMACAVPFNRFPLPVGPDTRAWDNLRLYLAWIHYCWCAAVHVEVGEHKWGPLLRVFKNGGRNYRQNVIIRDTTTIVKPGIYTVVGVEQGDS
ncbi:hypothetical protein BDR07DRAFT_1457744 [Suillus spraguei]|nr:hypothetical protein BDR07DRAFT_1457744 [Suillus spraguei]